MPFYAAPPAAPRMAYDRDGTVLVGVTNSNLGIIFTQAERERMNDETSSTSAKLGTDSDIQQRIAFLFPEARTLSNYYFEIDGNGNNGSLESSNDTTDGVDGTWTLVAATFTGHPGPSVPSYRTLITTQTITNVMAIRFNRNGSGGGSQVRNIHLYGSPVSNTDRLAMWHPSTNTALSGAALDWGDVIQTSTGDLTFRIKNLSATLTANNVVISMEALTDSTPVPQPGQHTFSIGAGYAGSQTITSIAPGAISAVVTMRRLTDEAASLSLWAQRVTAVATTWT